MNLIELAYQFLCDLEKILANPEISFRIPPELILACVIFAVATVPSAVAMLREIGSELELEELLEELDEIFDPIEPDRPMIKCGWTSERTP